MANELFMHKCILCLIVLHNKHNNCNKSLDLDQSMSIVLLATSNFYNLANHYIQEPHKVVPEDYLALIGLF